ncbi:hypothetical protein [Nannocystis radixulma]|uniref:Uncharacterized protein n=1 Tax=Nannocystis radixulma TaxID=2995305 RepID=A0ABT5BL49_9BACT|nr:hypothetical protein [Nannocystis radixulma]MDC0674893.1 hypothetical protein [Nannocystis radixulma]
MFASLLLSFTLAVSPRWAFENAYDNSNGGDWYIGDNNETALLAWGESYVLWSLAAMARATGHTQYFDRLARHIDAVLAQRDDARGVADYRGISGACWRNTHYQPDGEPYCYAVHSGMLVYPMVEFARLVATWRHRDALAYDGQTWTAKAAAYVAAAKETVAYHDDEWNPAGYYVFRADATFLEYAGVDQPLNQSNALGLALLALHDVTGEPAYLEKATALASRFKAQLTAGPDGEYLWNYWGGPYAGNGEDISHAALNVEFAALAAERGVVFSDDDVDRFALTFLRRVYRDDATFSDFVGGGPSNDASYRPQIGRWLPLARRRTAVYTAVHDVYARDYAPDAIGSGSLLLAWAYLAEHEPVVCPHEFYVVDWNDAGDHQQATAYGANILTVPPDLARGCRIALQVEVANETEAAQWDGEKYHPLTRWRPTAGFEPRSVPYEPRWPFEYSGDAVLFEFEDVFVPGEGIRVMEPPAFTLPAITSTPPTSAEVGAEVQYLPSGIGDPPYWWSLADGPLGLEVDPATGALAWTPSAPGPVTFNLVLENDLGRAAQEFVIEVLPVPSDTSTETGPEDPTTGEAPTTGEPMPETSGELDTSDEPDTTGTSVGSDDSASTTGGAVEEDGCGCRSDGRAGWSAALLLLGLRRRRTFRV